MSNPLYKGTLMKCFLIWVKWRQICVFISLPVVYTQHWDCFRYCEGDNWLKKTDPSSHSTILPSFTSFFSFCIQDEIIDKATKRQKDTVSHLPHFTQPSHASRSRLSLQQCGFHASQFCFPVQDAIAYFRQGIIMFCFIFDFQIASVIWNCECLSAYIIGVQCFINHKCITFILAPGIDIKLKIFKLN